MRFDDRLKTMLDAPVADARDRAVRWRQLVDLLSRTEAGPLSGPVEQALELVRREAFAIDETVRAATLRAIAGRTLPTALLRILAAQPMRIAAPLFAGLTLSASDADEILAEAEKEIRSLVTILPASAAGPQLTVASPDPPQPSIHEMVERIEELKQRRQAPPRSRPLTAPAPAAPSPRPPAPPHGESRLFEWETDASGHIAWVEGAPRGALVGRPLGGEGVALLERQASARLGQRHPFVDVPLATGEALAGTWSATGVPAFDPATGRFLGYRGLARRTDGAAAQAEVTREPDMDALRELVHEIRTPLNAIIGFAEIIDGQYLGPAHRRYRERAATIVGQARQLLEAVEDLDFAARLRAERARGHDERAGGPLSDLFPPIRAELEQCLAVQGGILALDLDDERYRCALSAELADRLLRRLLLSLCKVVGSGEVFRVAVTRREAKCLLTIARPQQLAGLAESQLVDPSFDPAGSEEGQSVGLGFALRLVRGLAKLAGGGLVIDEHRITLELPAAEC